VSDRLADDDGARATVAARLRRRVDGGGGADLLSFSDLSDEGEARDGEQNCDSDFHSNFRIPEP
jgi:hypothetical protein